MSDPAISKPPKPSSRGYGFIMGLGLGGFLDGIVMHQILQWHHMLTGTGDHPADTVAGKEANVLADGLFHLGTWLLVVIATILTLRAWRHRELAPNWKRYVGALLLGWGVFNVVEGIMNHQVLGIHHVRDDLGGPLSWDIAFLLSGLLMMGAGAALGRFVSPS